ncbi:hypothetical protein WAI453_008227 [Rhynchosporium graminicola]
MHVIGSLRETTGTQVELQKRKDRDDFILQRQPPTETNDKMVSAARHVPIVKKRTKRFHRHQSGKSKALLSNANERPNF